MKHHKISFSFILFVLFFYSFTVRSQQTEVALIPEPQKKALLTGTFSLSAKTPLVYAGEDARAAAELWNAFLFSNYGYKLKLTKGSSAPAGSIFIKTDKNAASEAYSLTIKNNKIELSGKAAGLFYGVQTLEQLAPLQKSTALKFPNISIQDAPRFGYRGLMLDVSRHFFSVEYVKQFIDVMAHYKLNRFHWHLTDDQGWRIEIKKYPKLQTVGAWREPMDNIRNSPFTKNGRYGGYYTQEEIKDVVAFAAKRHITVIPEIEMPGHSTAALASYPQLGCTGGPYTVLRHGMINKEVYCAGSDSTFAFLQDVLTEVMPLFPSQYIHIGGDETPKERWSQCPRCQARIKKEGLKNEHELQSYFIQRIEKFVNSKGRKIIGWDEILEGGLAPNATVMSWRGESGGIAAARQKHDVIMSPYTYLYLDYYQGSRSTEPPAFPAFLPLVTVYNYEPLSDSLTKEQHQYIKGVQGNVWGENISTGSHVDYMTYPRALAVSEIAWSPATAKNYDRFLQRLPVRLAAMEKAKVNFRIPEPVGFKDMITTESSVILNLAPTVKGATVYYTTDGSEPTSSSKQYTQPVTLNLTENVPVVVKTQVVLPSGRKSAVYPATYTRKAFKPAASVQPTKPGITFKTSFNTYKLAKDLKISQPDAQGTTELFSLEPLQRKPLGAIYEGYIQITSDDIYTFKVNSDDGAVLYIDDELVLENDGEHAASEVSGAIPLRKGYHKIRLQYFDAGGGRNLEVKASTKAGNYPLKNKLFY